MATNSRATKLDGTAHWGVVSASGISPLDGVYPTTAALIEQGEADWRAASGKASQRTDKFGEDSFPGNGTLSRLLSGRQLPPAHD